MAVYKVIQDVEAEDKLVGFLTLRTFIYAIIAITLSYIAIRISLAPQLGAVRWLVVAISVPPIMLFGILSLPLGREQPTEVWLLSRLRFFMKPRIRTWNQSGTEELVTITAPKKIDRQLTKNFTETEVQSRLRALATTLDSRGWAVKNVAVNLTSMPGYFDNDQESDRLVSASSVTQQQAVDVSPADDIMDEQNNPTAQKFDALMKRASVNRKQAVAKKLDEVRTNAEPKENIDFEFLDKVPTSSDYKATTNFVGRKIISPGSRVSTDEIAAAVSAEEKAFLDKKHETDEYVHAHAPITISKKNPPETQKTEVKNPKPATPAQVTQAVQTDKLEELIQTAKDYSYKVSTVEKLANRDSGQFKQIGPNEVEIDLH
jgi:hypothetical protein